MLFRSHTDYIRVKGCFQNALSNKLGDLALPTSVANNAVAFVAILKTLDFDSPIRQAYFIAYSHSFKKVFIAMAEIVGVGSICSLLIQKFTMDRRLESEHIIRK